MVRVKTSGVTKMENHNYIKEAERLTEISQGIDDYYLWVLCGVGLPANIMTIVTILTMQAMTPATFFVTCLAYFDGSALLAKLVIKLLIHHATSYLNVLCVMEFIPIFLQTVANWMLVFICVERFISVCYPLKKVYLVTKRRSYICAAVVVTGFLVFFASVFGVMRRNQGLKCTMYPAFAWFWDEVWKWILCCLLIFFPFVSILGLTIAIIRGLRNSSRDRRSLLRKGSGSVTNASGHQRSSAINERQIAEAERLERTITLMMVLAAILFLVFSLPSGVYFLMPRQSDGIEYYRQFLLGQVQYLLLDTTHALNFFLYFFTAKRFRSQLIKIVCCKKCRKRFRKRNKLNTKTGKKQSLSLTEITHVGT
ncbi:unnamed protein product [Lymnaea stagnalis]|uniref:G-protein coupled receptors family 1 profile domain-containing protein n=1 Tax=Lymnaea stagnalis TaxID=6523 RepID=A0AAV2I1F6_LYMST